MFSIVALYIVSGILNGMGIGCIAYLILERRIHAVPMWLVILATFALLFVERLILFTSFSQLELTIKTSNTWLIDLLKTDDLTGSLSMITTTGVVLMAVKAAIGACLARLLVRPVLGHEGA